MEDWNVSDIVEYGTAFFNKQAEVADLPKPSDPDDPGWFAKRVYREARRRAHEWLEEHPGYKPAGSEEKSKRVKVPRAAGIEIAEAMDRTFGVTPEEMVVIREREHEPGQRLQSVGMSYDEMVAYAVKRGKALDNEPDPGEYYRKEEFLFRNLVVYMLNALISKRNGGKSLDLGRLKSDLSSYADLVDFVAEQGPDETSVRQVEKLYQRLSHYENYLWQEPEMRGTTGIKGYDQGAYGRFSPFAERDHSYGPEGRSVSAGRSSAACNLD